MFNRLIISSLLLASTVLWFSCNKAGDEIPPVKPTYEINASITDTSPALKKFKADVTSSFDASNGRLTLTATHSTLGLMTIKLSTGETDVKSIKPGVYVLDSTGTLPAKFMSIIEFGGKTTTGIIQPPHVRNPGVVISKAGQDQLSGKITTVGTFECATSSPADSSKYIHHISEGGFTVLFN